MAKPTLRGSVPTAEVQGVAGATGTCGLPTLAPWRQRPEMWTFRTFTLIVLAADSGTDRCPRLRNMHVNFRRLYRPWHRSRRRPALRSTCRSPPHCRDPCRGRIVKAHTGPSRILGAVAAKVWFRDRRRSQGMSVKSVTCRTRARNIPVVSRISSLPSSTRLPAATATIGSQP